MAGKGVIVEYDFAAMDGAGLLFDTMKGFLAGLDGIPFDSAIEARHFAGGNYQGCFTEYFPVVKTKKTALKAAKDFDALFRRRLAELIPTSVSTGFRNFVKILSERDVAVVIATRADLAAVDGAFAPLLGDNVRLHHEESVSYGAPKWDAWLRACAAAGLKSRSTLAVTGSGIGVKAALRAGLGSVAVINDRVAYQDFTGVDEIVRDLNVSTAKTVLDILRV